jgi:hypothetical protein
MGEHSVAAAVRAAVRGDAALLGASDAVGGGAHVVVELQSRKKEKCQWKSRILLLAKLVKQLHTHIYIHSVM